MKNKLKDLWLTLVEKVSDNKETVIRVVGVAAGVVVGAVGATIVANMQQEAAVNQMLFEEDEIENETDEA